MTKFCLLFNLNYFVWLFYVEWNFVEINKREKHRVQIVDIG